MVSLPLKKACPKCRKLDSLTIVKNLISCNNSDCKFEVSFSCPICDHSFENESFEENPIEYIFNCSQCKNKVSTRKVAYLIENSLRMDHDTRCGICNSPTVHRPDMNFSNRCFFFPKCSGQSNLFGEAQESLTFLDFETTGLQVGRDYIIEVGAIKIDEEGYEHTFQRFVKPPVEIDPRITKITGITDDMLFEAHSLKEVMEDFIEFAGNSKIVAHNADFDVPWLLTTSLRHNLNLKNNPVICTLKWAKAIEEPRVSLGVLTKKYKINHENAHRALADAVSTKELYFIFDNINRSLAPVGSIDDFREQSEQAVARYKEFVQS